MVQLCVRRGADAFLVKPLGSEEVRLLWQFVRDLPEGSFKKDRNASFSRDNSREGSQERYQQRETADNHCSQPSSSPGSSSFSLGQRSPDSARSVITSAGGQLGGQPQSAPQEIPQRQNAGQQPALSDAQHPVLSAAACAGGAGSSGPERVLICGGCAGAQADTIVWPPRNAAHVRAANTRPSGRMCRPSSEYESAESGNETHETPVCSQLIAVPRQPLAVPIARVALESETLCTGLHETLAGLEGVRVGGTSSGDSEEKRQERIEAVSRELRRGCRGSPLQRGRRSTRASGESSDSREGGADEPAPAVMADCKQQ